ncbi:exonuclease II Exo2 [Malassezia brasiliensis]|uniref:5'-3' exoribonuclease 1 n=1 Tax=Malassezia brasiliensis TaxID=1821822 RepID=A0AAF0IQ09_9BASI|nr:exonuclease II Exo2 [Malassezia brasiliensis]
MGVPKYFKWLSERYPLIMQLVEENRIPEFDNLYLDMNGIIHNCSHPRDDEATFRISEEDIFLGIFAYIEHLFSKIRPQKVFFLAIDGVAPRAKMNQQRSRRFRTAQEAKENLEKARRRGEAIPDSAPFDSNCITPGTIFMQKLSLQLEYFIAKKVSEDANWRNVQVILSGHDTVGEGEHKIMEFIRTIKAQPDYNPNTRHCLYGLDADLIMLGLLSHDPHFALLREEVIFGPQRGKKTASLETQTFYLLHISLLREYLELEFAGLRDKLPFEFDLERIIDDYILLHLFVGNDFLPHLPGLHINEGAIELLFRIYEKVLPAAGGYLNDHGTLRPERLQLVIDELFALERSNFLKDHPELTRAKAPARRKKRAPKKAARTVVVTPQQREWIARLQRFALAFETHPDTAESETSFPSPLSDADQALLAELGTRLGLLVARNEYDPVDDATATVLRVPPQKVKQLRDDQAREESFPEERRLAIERALGPYVHAQVGEVPVGAEAPAAEGDGDEGDGDVSEAAAEAAAAAAREQEITRRMHAHKVAYYRTKLEMAYEPEAIRALVFNYIEGMQWVLHYYYEGNASWGWFYRYHYAPQISDLTNIGEFAFAFEKGTPFLPFEQLMGVLPPLSKALIPPALQDLMTDPSSPILDFYPTEFEADMNGKKNSWEAVVKIPFIQEDRLLDAMRRRAGGLTDDERVRNRHGPPKRFAFDAALDYTYPSSLPGFFPDLPNNHVRVETYDLPSMHGRTLVKTLPAGVQLGVDAMPGFPTLKTLPFTHALRKAGVNVHGTASAAPSMILTIRPVPEVPRLEALAQAVIGQRTFTNWPFLFEGLVVGVSDAHAEIMAELRDGNQVRLEKQRGASVAGHADRIRARYATRYGVDIGTTRVLLHVRPLQGLHRLPNAAVAKEYAATPQGEIEYPLQLMVDRVAHEDQRFLERPGMSVSEEFPDQTRVFYLGERGYGCPARVLGTTSSTVAIELALLTDMAQENMLMRKLVGERAAEKYVPAAQVAHRLKISSIVLSRITSSMLVQVDRNRRNLGLNLKFEAKSRKVLGYTQRTSLGWEYSERAIELIAAFVRAFPELVRAVARRPPHGDFYRDVDLFPQNTAERIQALVAFEKQHKLRELEDVPIYVDRLETQTVATLEAATRILARKRAESGTFGIKRQILRGLPRYALLKPDQARMRVPTQHFHLGDRVVNVLDFGAVPPAAKGTVVGLGANSIDVVFDAPYLGGTSLNGLCSDYRGGTVGLADVLNLTTPQMATKWGVEATQSDDTSALLRTLQAREQARAAAAPPPAKPNQPKNFFTPAPPPKTPTAKPGRSAAPGAQPKAPHAPKTPADAAAAHLQTLSLHTKPRAPKQAWKKPAPKAHGTAK